MAATALGSHGLEQRLSAAEVATWNTAAGVHLMHSLALLALALFGLATRRSVRVPGALFSAGMGLFAGSLYALLLGGPRLLGQLTPLGGAFLLAGWLSLPLLARTSPKGTGGSER